jgi:hypothetical protein
LNFQSFIIADCLILRRGDRGAIKKGMPRADRTK